MYGVGAELAQAMNELCFDDLDGPVARLHTAPVSHPFAPSLERAMLVSTEAIVERARRVMRGHADPIARAGSTSGARAARAPAPVKVNAPNPVSGRTHALRGARASDRRRRSDHDAVRGSDGERRAPRQVAPQARAIPLPRANTSPTSRPRRRSSRSNPRKTAFSPQILAEEGAVVPMGASIGIVREGG